MSVNDVIRVMQDVSAERARQDAKWGEQNHADGTGPRAYVLEALSDYAPTLLQYAAAEDLAEAARDACQANGAPETPDTWTAILLEEVFEALAEDDPEKLRTELVQVAAVAQQWVEAIDRRSGKI